jgi:hypothetical protein
MLLSETNVGAGRTGGLSAIGQSISLVLHGLKNAFGYVATRCCNIAESIDLQKDRCCVSLV